MRLALYQPDIPQNLGTIMRLCACMDVTLDIIEPCGFPLNDRKIKRAGMDYIEHLKWNRHDSWEDFLLNKPKDARLVLMTTKASVPYTEFAFQETDILLAGRESAGVPENVHKIVDGRVIIPMKGQTRSLNIALSCSMILGEALRQTNLL